VEDHSESAMSNLALEIPWYYLVAFAGITLVCTSNGEDIPGESILEALNESGESDDWDLKGYDSNHYDAAMRKIEAELRQQELEEQQAAAKQVFITNKGDDAGKTTSDPPSQAVHDGDAGEEQGNSPLAAYPAKEQLPEIHGRPRAPQPAIPEDQRPEDFTTPLDKIIY
jgi:hypothetical protein